MWSAAAVAAPSALPVSSSFEQPQPSLVAPTAGLEASSAAVTTVNNAGVVENSAAANGRFDIVIRYTGDPTYQAAFTQAAARWSQIITGDIPDFNSSQYGLIDDLLIDASIVAIDGSGGILGQAGPDLLRPSPSRLPAHGEMEFNSADVATMFASGTWTNVILHEIGHILGIGTIWSLLGLKNGAGDYIGVHGLAEYRALIGNPSAASVPIEHDGGRGTAGAHWDEDTFNAELMTGFAEIGRHSDADQPDDGRLARGPRIHRQLRGRRRLHAAGRRAGRRHHRRCGKQQPRRHGRRRHHHGPRRQRHARRCRRQRHARRRDGQRFDRRRQRRRHGGLHRQSGQLRAGGSRRPHHDLGPGRERHAGRGRAPALRRRHDPPQRRQHAVRHGVL